MSQGSFQNSNRHQTLDPGGSNLLLELLCCPLSVCNGMFVYCIERRIFNNVSDHSSWPRTTRILAYSSVICKLIFIVDIITLGVIESVL